MRQRVLRSRSPRRGLLRPRPRPSRPRKSPPRSPPQRKRRRSRQRSVRELCPHFPDSPGGQDRPWPPGHIRPSIEVPTPGKPTSASPKSAAALHGTSHTAGSRSASRAEAATVPSRSRQIIPVDDRAARTRIDGAAAWSPEQPRARDCRLRRKQARGGDAAETGFIFRPVVERSLASATSQSCRPPALR